MIHLFEDISDFIVDVVAPIVICLLAIVLGAEVGYLIWWALIR